MKFSMRGEIVGKSAIFGMETAPSDDDPTELKISFLFVDGTRLEHAATYPGDFTEPAPWSEDGAQALALPLPLEEVSGTVPLRRVEVSSDGNEIEFSRFWDLDRLFPTDRTEFKNWMFRAIHRPKGEGTLVFLTRQILDHYDLNIGDRCAAAVIYAYRAMEMMDAEMTARAISVSRQLIDEADSLPENDHPRRGRQLLRSSLFTVLWQLYLSVDDKDGLMETLKAYTGEVLENDKAPAIVCVNLIPACLFYGYLLQQNGTTDEAETVLWSAYRYYRAKANELPDNPTFFYEFSKPFHAASICLALALVQRGDDWRGPPKELGSSRHIFQTSIRVNEPTAAARMKKNFLGMIRQSAD